MSFNYNEIKKNDKQELLTKLKNKYIDFDNDYFNNFYDYKLLKVIKKRNRTVWTEYGQITYSRRIYINKTNGKVFCPTDLQVGIQPYKRIINDVKELIINELPSGKRNKDILDKIPLVKISSVTISNILKTVKLDMINCKIKLKPNTILYINMDDCYINLRNKNHNNKHRIRVISFNTGISKDKNKYSYKNVLENKRITFIVTKEKETITKQKFLQFIKTQINIFYDVDNPKLIVGGDGAPWIKAIAQELGTEYILDRYHAYKYLWKTFIYNSKNFSHYNIACQLFKKGKSVELIQFLKEKTKMVDVLNYFENNQIGVTNQSKEWNIGVSAESDIFHLVKSLKGNGAKIYNSQRFINMVIAKTNVINARI